MYQTDSINVEQATYAKPLFKKSDIVATIKHDLVEKFIKQAELKYEYAKAKFKNSDKLHSILTEACKVFPEHREFFEKTLEQYTNINLPSKYVYVGYDKEQVIEKNVTKFLIDNEDFTYKEIYDFVTKDIKND